MTIQEQLKAQLEKTGIPAKEIRVYGSQIMITAWSEAAAKRWAHVLNGFATTVRPIVRSMDETKDDSRIRKANPGLVKSKFHHDVWRVWATV